MTNEISKIGLNGIQTGLKNAAEKVDRISRSFSSENGEDPTNDIVGLKQNAYQVKASAAFIKSTKDLEDSVLDILA